MAGDMISNDDTATGVSVLPERAPRRRRGTQATALTAAALLVGTAGVAAAIFRSTTSERDPATVIPANAFGVATIHLDLPGGQEGAIDHILSLFPGVNLPAGGSLRDRVLRLMFHDSTPPVDYDKNIKPWLGDTATVAGWLDNGKPTMEFVLASTDDAAARADLPATLSDGEHFQVHDGFAFLGSDQAQIDDAVHAAATSSLADSGTYSGDVGALPANEAVTGWLDGPSALKAIQGALGGASGGFSMFGGALGSSGFTSALKDRLALGLHATDDAVQVDVRTVGGSTKFASAPSSMLTQLPSGTVGAFELGDPAGVLDAVTPVVKMFGSFTAGTTQECVGSAVIAPTPALTKAERRRMMHRYYGNTGPHCTTHVVPPVDPFQQIQKVLGISFPDDVKTLLGDRAVVAFGGLELGGLPDVAIRSHPTDLSAAQSVAQTLSSHLSSKTPLQLSTTTAGSDLVLATSPSYGAEVGKDGTLGDVAQVKQALDGMPSQVSGAFYLDLSRIWGIAGAGVPDGVKHVKALGLWAGASGDVSTAQLRVVFG